MLPLGIVVLGERRGTAIPEQARRWRLLNLWMTEPLISSPHNGFPLLSRPLQVCRPLRSRSFQPSIHEVVHWPGWADPTRERLSFPCENRLHVFPGAQIG